MHMHILIYFITVSFFNFLTEQHTCLNMYIHIQIYGTYVSMNEFYFIIIIIILSINIKFVWKLTILLIVNIYLTYKYFLLIFNTNLKCITKTVTVKLFYTLRNDKNIFKKFKICLTSLLDIAQDENIS